MKIYINLLFIFGFTNSRCSSTVNAFEFIFKLRNTCLIYIKYYISKSLKYYTNLCRKNSQIVRNLTTTKTIVGSFFFFCESFENIATHVMSFIVVAY